MTSFIINYTHTIENIQLLAHILQVLLKEQLKVVVGDEGVNNVAHVSEAANTGQ